MKVKKGTSRIGKKLATTYDQKVPDDREHKEDILDVLGLFWTDGTWI